MKVALLIITHNKIGQELITTAGSIIGSNTPPIHSISVPAELSPGDLGGYADQIRDTISELSSRQKILVLTDIYGATPNNLARYFANNINTMVISGLNLPMLLRVLNYRTEDLDQLATTALEGARKGIVQG